MKPTMTSMLPTPPTKVATNSGHTQERSSPRPSRAAVNTVCGMPPVINTCLLPIVRMTFGATKPSTTVPMPGTPKGGPAADGEKTREIPVKKAIRPATSPQATQGLLSTPSGTGRTLTLRSAAQNTLSNSRRRRRQQRHGGSPSRAHRRPG